MICRMGQINFVFHHVQTRVSHRKRPRSHGRSLQGGEDGRCCGVPRHPNPATRVREICFCTIAFICIPFSFPHLANFSSFCSTSLEGSRGRKVCCDRRATHDRQSSLERGHRVPHWTALVLRMHGISFLFPFHSFFALCTQHNQLRMKAGGRSSSYLAVRNGGQ